VPGKYGRISIRRILVVPDGRRDSELLAVEEKCGRSGSSPHEEIGGLRIVCPLQLALATKSGTPARGRSFRRPSYAKNFLIDGVRIHARTADGGTKILRAEQEFSAASGAFRCGLLPSIPASLSRSLA
jgi:hypothetical protein